jgi:hypothetical protein
LKEFGSSAQAGAAIADRGRFDERGPLYSRTRAVAHVTTAALGDRVGFPLPLTFGLKLRSKRSKQCNCDGKIAV